MLIATSDGNSVGGTNPALLEAMATCKRIMAIDINFSREVLGEFGIYFNPDNIINIFHMVVRENEQSQQLKKRVYEKYDWIEVSNSYMRIARKKNPSYLKSEVYYEI